MGKKASDVSMLLPCSMLGVGILILKSTVTCEQTKIRRKFEILFLFISTLEVVE